MGDVNYRTGQSGALSFLGGVLQRYVQQRDLEDARKREDATTADERKWKEGILDRDRAEKTDAATTEHERALELAAFRNLGTAAEQGILTPDLIEATRKQFPNAKIDAFIPGWNAINAGSIAKNKEKGAVDPLDYEKTVLGLLPKDMTEDARYKVLSTWDGKTPLWRHIHDTYPNGYPSTEADKNRLYKSVQDAYNDISKRDLNKKYTAETVKNMADYAYQFGMDVGMVESKMMEKGLIQYSPEGIAIQRRKLSDDIELIEPDLDPKTRVEAANMVIKAQQSGGYMSTEEAVGIAKINVFATKILSRVVPVNQVDNAKAKPVDFNALNESLRRMGNPTQFSPGEGSGTTLNLIADMKEKGFDEETIAKLIPSAWGKIYEPGILEKGMNAIGGAFITPGKEGMPHYPGGVRPEVTPGDKIPDLYPSMGDVWNAWGKGATAIAPGAALKYLKQQLNEYRTNPFMGPDHPNTKKTERLIAELEQKMRENPDSTGWERFWSSFAKKAKITE